MRGPSRPLLGAQLDKGAQLVRGLVSLAVPLPFGVFDFVTGTQLSVAGGVTRVGDPLFGQGLAFDGSTGLITQPYSTRLNCLAGVTLAVWARLSTGVGRTLIGKPFAVTHTSPWWDYVLFRDTGNNIHFRVGATGVSAGTYLDSTTYHIALTADGARFCWYRNGQLHATSAQTTLPTNTNSRPLHIGANAATGEAFDGTIYAGWVWDRPLNEAEVWAHYSDDPFGVLAQPIAARRFRPRQGAVDPRGEMRYWRDGAPFGGLNIATRAGGEMQFWRDGASFPYIFLQSVVGAETFRLGLSESTAVVVRVATVDAIAAALGETTRLRVLLSPTDQARLAGSEAVAIVARLSPTDQVAVGETDRTALRARFGATDAVGVRETESAAIFVSVAAVAEALRVSATEATRLIVAAAASDALIVATVEVADLEIEIVETSPQSSAPGGLGWNTGDYRVLPTVATIRRRWF